MLDEKNQLGCFFESKNKNHYHTIKLLESNNTVSESNVIDFRHNHLNTINAYSIKSVLGGTAAGYQTIR